MDLTFLLLNCKLSQSARAIDFLPYPNSCQILYYTNVVLKVSVIFTYFYFNEFQRHIMSNIHTEFFHELITYKGIIFFYSSTFLVMVENVTFPKNLTNYYSSLTPIQ